MNTIKLAKKGIFIYNILSSREMTRRLVYMFNMHNNKTRRIISSVIIIIIVLAMLIPTLTYFIF